MRQLRLDQFVAPGEWCHYASPRIGPGDPTLPHTHDFHEIFWVTSGRAAHHVNGIEQALRPGMLVVIVPADVHGFETSHAAGFQLVNVAFHTSTWDDLQQRYFPSEPSWADRPVEQRTYELSDPEQQLLTTHAAEIAGNVRSRSSIDRFLLNVLHLLTCGPARSHGAMRWPDWLAQACHEISENRRFSGGTRELARLAGKSPEHLARELRRVCGKSPTEVINEARMTYAAGRLARTNDPILDIALDCGLENLGHFYRLFRDRHGLTPRQYRVREQRIVRPGQ